MTRTNADLMVSEVAAIAGCHPNTVRRYEHRGVVRPQRDLNGYRRYTMEQALELRDALARRVNNLSRKYSQGENRT